MTMKISDAGLKVTALREGWMAKAYDDGAGYMTIGFGHKILPNEKHYLKETLSKDDGLELLRADMKIAEDAVNKYVKVPLEQHQFDALCDFTFNCGVGAFSTSTLLKLLNGGMYDAVPAQLRRWTRAGGKVMKGLVVRRETEVSMWNGKYVTV